MQRRAAAVYFVLFVVVGAGAYGFMQVGMSQPTVDMDGPTFSAGDELTVEDRTYTVDGLSTDQGEVTTYQGDVDLVWFNESRRETATLENDSTVTYRDDQYTVVVTGNETFSLVEELNVSAILADDPAVENETVTRNDEEFVVSTANQSITPLSEYLPEPERIEFAEGDGYEYRVENGTVDATVDSVAEDGVRISWEAPGNETVTLSQGENETLNGVEHFAHFPSENQVQILPTDQRYDEYSAEIATINSWDQRRNGVWGIVILSFLAGLVLLSTAYLPVKG